MTDRWMNGWADVRKNNVALHTLTMWGSHVESLVKFRPVV